MRHNYKCIVAYDPAENQITFYKGLGEEYLFEEKLLDTAFYEVYYNTNKMNEMILGISVGGDLYQLSPASYGTYIKEDSTSTRFLKKGRVLCAITAYKQKHDIPLEGE